MASLSQALSLWNHSGSAFNASSRCRADLCRSLIVSYPVSPFPRLRLILGHLEDPPSDPNLSHDAPPGDEGARKGGVCEIDGKGVFGTPRVPEGRRRKVSGLFTSGWRYIGMATRLARMQFGYLSESFTPPDAGWNRNLLIKQILLSNGLGSGCRNFLHLVKPNDGRSILTY